MRLKSLWRYLQKFPTISFSTNIGTNLQMKFKQQAQEKSSQNEGVLLPAHHVFSNYFQKGAYLVPKE